jgi:hypothetical protein
MNIAAGYLSRRTRIPRRLNCSSDMLVRTGVRGCGILPAGFVESCQPTPSSNSRSDEIKQEGYRIIAGKRGARVRSAPAAAPTWPSATRARTSPTATGARCGILHHRCRDGL